MSKSYPDNSPEATARRVEGTRRFYEYLESHKDLKQLSRARQYRQAYLDGIVSLEFLQHKDKRVYRYVMKYKGAAA